MAEPQRPAGRAASAEAGHLYPVDIKEEKPEVLEAAAQECYAKLLEQPSSVVEFCSIPGRERVKLEASSVRSLSLYRQDSQRTLLVLNDPQQKDTVLAIYLHNSWWPVEDIVKTADPSREGLIQVQTFRERIVLFVLNYIIFGMQERSSTWDAVFVPHSERERAKIFWRSGEAVAFYTVKAKGSLCDEHSSRCYQLPVLDTVFVRKKFRRCGLGTAMLQDFCETFATEDALGISCPISAEMYQVCRQFLDTHPEEQSRLWEVEAPGDWSQRTSIWLTVQLAQNHPEREITNVLRCDFSPPSWEMASTTADDDLACRTENPQEDEPGDAGDGQVNKGAAQVLNVWALRDQAEEFKDDCDEPLDSQPGAEEHVSQRGGEMCQYKEPKKRVRRGGPKEDRAPKQLKAVPYDRGDRS
ncbi:protein FAM169B-like [Heteronotia binoei]|uniref:protein FAM169B-like n=1 Tax=Heteronotia binoei TaxID=13085 RepID=UPI00292D1C85|nr:protein FAM169B-like [Heteronotia binoei]